MSKTVNPGPAELVTKPDLPPPVDGEVELIDRYLRHMHDRILHSLNDHRALAAFQKDKRTQGIIQYQRNQIQTLETLIANNLQRLNRGTPTGPRRKRGA